MGSGKTRPILRRRFHLAAAVSLMLCLATAGAVARSYFICERFGYAWEENHAGIVIGCIVEDGTFGVVRNVIRDYSELGLSSHWIHLTDPPAAWKPAHL